MSLQALTNAILDKNIHMVEHCLQTTADINARDPYGYTPLIEAGIVDDTAIAQLLLQHGADPNTQDMTGASALHWACENGNISLAELLLQHGANPNLYTTSSESPLVVPYLRHNRPIMQLMMQHHASLRFAKDFIHAKLLGHRFSLRGSVDILDPNNKFTEVNLEGFFLEFSLDIILNSLQSYIKNFAAKEHQQYFTVLHKLVDAFTVACQLAHYQQYQKNVDHYEKALRTLVQRDLLIIPVGYEGHAITVIRFHNLLVVCNRRRANRFADQLPIYRMEAPDALDWPLLKHLLFERNSAQFIEMELLRHLQCTPISRLFIKRQITGNCSWANVEAAIPISLFFLVHDWRETPPQLIAHQNPALVLYREWAEWDRDRALGYFLQRFDHGSPAEKAAVGAILADVLFQRCGVNFALDRKRAKRILKAIDTPDYSYILESYRKHYQQERPSLGGQNLEKMIKRLDDPFA